ncbi:YciI family protein [Nonomuraea sp. NPDC050540]|uniref:YciI family protein n=1 Tax=Nonomuraea sp. NPDC050540 TaxID=3364367 RepID=UPI00346F01C9
MKYLILIYSGPEGAERPDLADEVTEPGELVAGGVLADPVNTVTVRVARGAALEEQLSGYLVVDCDSGHRAAEIAARVPGARTSTVEVRPIMDLSGQEM